MTRVPVKYLQERVIRVAHYLNNFLFACPKRRVEAAKKEVSNLMNNLDIIHSDKFNFAHEKEKEFIDFVINLASVQNTINQEVQRSLLEGGKEDA